MKKNKRRNTTRFSSTFFLELSHFFSILNLGYVGVDDFGIKVQSGATLVPKITTFHLNKLLHYLRVPTNMNEDYLAIKWLGFTAITVLRFSYILRTLIYT